MGGTSRPESAKDPNVLDISAPLYSVALRCSVALVGMQYTGASIADATTKFAKKLAQSVPNMKCANWNWNANIDPARIRPSTEE
jgi:hypothetical protein